MNVRLFALMNHYAFGSNILILMDIVEEGKKGVKLQQRLGQVVILITQLVIFIHNAIHARHL